MNKMQKRKVIGLAVTAPFVWCTTLLSRFIGRERALRRLGPYLTAIARLFLKRSYIPDIGDASEFDRFKTKLKSNFRRWDLLFDIDIVREDEEILKTRVSNCPFCECLIDLGQPELAPYVCLGDWEVAKENAGKWKFERAHQIGTGSDFCNHTYKRIKGCILFDWGNTLMRNHAEYSGPMATWPEVTALPQAEEVLAALNSGWRLALTTNAEDSDETAIRAALDRVGLTPFLDSIYCYRKVGHKKPSSAFFDFILEDLRIARSGLVMIGDDFENDCLGANRSGIRAVWLNEHTGEKKTGDMHRTIHALADLPQLLRNW